MAQPPQRTSPPHFSTFPKWLCLPAAPDPTGYPSGVGRSQSEAKISVSTIHYFKGGGGPLPSASWSCHSSVSRSGFPSFYWDTDKLCIFLGEHLGWGGLRKAWSSRWFMKVLNYRDKMSRREPRWYRQICPVSPNLNILWSIWRMPYILISSRLRMPGLNQWIEATERVGNQVQ